MTAGRSYPAAGPAATSSFFLPFFFFFFFFDWVLRVASTNPSCSRVATRTTAFFSLPFLASFRPAWFRVIVTVPLLPPAIVLPLLVPRSVPALDFFFFFFFFSSSCPSWRRRPAAGGRLAE